ncbi:T9SS type A sorting domain-containing protein [Rufibacter roseus]|uniref:T9SS type A sorting domain-containing protein n=1 Tax=Rufibacter roseus TaxID=1567108 RepID=A0ABW2DGT9_9BACT|nr:T9SS type A sorting domain-containing protein [Rufibacter roseus]
MKRKLLLLSLGLFGSAAAFAQGFTIQNLELEVQHGDISAIDVNRDGHIDLLIGGHNTTVMLLMNDGSGNFVPAESIFMGSKHVSYSWGDINGDGLPDLAQAGIHEPNNINPYTNIFTSNAAGVFTAFTGVTLPQMSPSVGLADLNNDGYQDIFLFGNKQGGKSKIFFNNKQGGFTESAQFDAFDLWEPIVEAIDYDLDGDLDLFMMAANDANLPNTVRYSRVLENNGSGVFTERNLGLQPKGNGSYSWGDYDSDGDLDILLNGDGWLGSGEDNDNIYRLYRNDNGTFVEAAIFMDYRQISLGDGSRFADWDNDGDLDIIVTGWSHNQGRQATDIYLNNNGTFTPHADNAKIPGVSESAIEVADTDNDGDLDLIMTGFSGNNYNGAGSAFARNVSLIVKNPTTTTNAAPSMPANLRASLGSNGDITFTWDAATDDKTSQNSLSYNLFVVGPDGRHFSYAMADTTTGKLMMQKMGNVALNRSWTLKGLPEGKYRWGVQAIDNAYVGSQFAKKSFSVAGGVLGAKDARAKFEMAVYPNPSQGLVNVKFENGKNYHVRVNAIDGRFVTETSASGAAQLQLTPGIYVMQVTDNQGSVETRRIVVQ